LERRCAGAIGRRQEVEATKPEAEKKNGKASPVSPPPLASVPARGARSAPFPPLRAAPASSVAALSARKRARFKAPSWYLPGGGRGSLRFSFFPSSSAPLSRARGPGVGVSLLLLARNSRRTRAPSSNAKGAAKGTASHKRMRCCCGEGLSSSSPPPPRQRAEGRREREGGRREEKGEENEERGRKKSRVFFHFPSPSLLEERCRLLSTRRAARLEGQCPARSASVQRRSSPILPCAWSPPSRAPRPPILRSASTGAVDDGVAPRPSSPGRRRRHRARSRRRRGSPRASSGSRRQTETSMTTSACSSPG
jgi:hypothetical protein